MSGEACAADAATVDARLARADARFDLALRARILAALFAAGATLALLTAALPHSSRANVTGVLAVVGVAYATAGLLFWSARRVVAGVLPLALAGGTTLITLVSYFSAENPSPLSSSTCGCSSTRLTSSRRKCSSRRSPTSARRSRSC